MRTTNYHFNIASSVASVFSSPTRLKIIYILAQAPRSVEVISKMTGETIANTSQHLQKLLREGFVISHKEKLSKIYKLKEELISLILEELFNLSEKIKENTENESAPVLNINAKPISLLSIVEDIQNNKAIILDIRDEYETSQTPVSNAISLPLETLAEKAKTLKKNKTYYVFCRGRACEHASKGVNILQAAGLKAFRLKESPTSIRHIINTYTL